MMGNLCTILGFICLIVVYVLENIHLCGNTSRLFGVASKIKIIKIMAWKQNSLTIKNTLNCKI